MLPSRRLTWLLAVPVLAAAGVGLVLWLRPPARPAPATGPAIPSPAIPGPETARTGATEPVERAQAGGAPIEARPELAPGASSSDGAQARFELEVTLAGEGEATPASWRLEARRDALRGAAAPSGAARVSLELEGPSALVELPSGAWFVRAVATGTASEVRRVELSARQPRAALTLVLDPTTSATGVVRAEDGRAVEGLTVGLAVLGGVLPLEATTDPSGRFVLESVPPGEYTLLLGTPERPLARFEGRRVELDPFGRAEFLGEFTAPATFDIDVTVVDARGVAATGVRVQGECSGGGSIDATTDLAGRVRGLHLGAGEMRVFARAQDGSRANRVVEIGPQGVRELELVLVARGAEPPPRR